MLFVCLLAPVAMAAYPWNNQMEWRGTAGDANWANPANWTQEGDNPCPETGPGPDFLCCILPNQPGPRISGNATCSMLCLNPWDPSPWGGQDVNIIVNADALDVNFGSAIQIASQTDYDAYLGGSTLIQKAMVNVYGGTVRTPNQNGNTGNMMGITIGGGSTNYGMAYGQLNIYGGEVNVPRLVLNFGEVGLYGGTLRINSDPNFSLRTDHPMTALNLLKVNGGTFALLGDHTVDINTLRTSSHIICERGTLRDPVYDGSWTTLVADINYCVWSPTPTNGATNVHYYTADGNSVTLSWKPSTFEDIDVNHDIYFGTSSWDVNLATKDSDPCGYYMGSLCDDVCDPCSYVIKDPNKFLFNTTYYWRVDENSVSNGFKKGLVWSFKTHDGKAYNPKPATGATALSQPLQLSWTAGDWATYHNVFFATSSAKVNAATTATTDGRYRGSVSSPVYPLSRLLETAPGGTFTLQNGTTYYWRIDEVNGTTVWKGSPWSFTPGGYTNIDDFEDSASTDDVNANWPDNYAVTGCDTILAHSGRILVRDSSGKYLQYTYNNSMMNPAFTNYFTEAKRPYAGGTSFTGGGVVFPTAKLLRVDYKGRATNPGPPMPEGYAETLDNMYVAIEDTAGNVSVYLNPDPNAQMVGEWTSWYTKLTDINDGSKNSNGISTDLGAITGFSLGFGIRCNNYDADGSSDSDPNGIVFFDNIRLYGATCVSEYGPTADLDGDCDVDINDMDSMATDWLTHADSLLYPGSTPPHKAPILWYKFTNEGGSEANTLVTDYGTGDANAYTGTINSFIASNWKAGYGRDGGTCLYLPPSGGCYVAAPVSSLNFEGDANHTTASGGGVSFSVWINADTTADNMKTSWNGLFGIWDGTAASETLEVHCPAPLSATVDSSGPRTNFIKRSPAATASAFNMSASDYGGKWNHWVMTKSADSTLQTYSLKVYHNGTLMGHYDSNGLTGDPNINAYGRLFDPNVGAFRIGTRGTNWGLWNGYIQDFQVYDYNLSDNEVAYLALDGAASLFVPLVSPANINADGSASPLTDVNQIVNFGDLAIMCNQWHTQILYPPD